MFECTGLGNRPRPDTTFRPDPWQQNRVKDSLLVSRPSSLALLCPEHEKGNGPAGLFPLKSRVGGVYDFDALIRLAAALRRDL